MDETDVETYASPSGSGLIILPATPHEKSSRFTVPTQLLGVEKKDASVVNFVRKNGGIVARGFLIMAC